MNIVEIKQGLSAYFTREAPDQTAGLTFQTNLFESGILDSLQIITMISHVEEEYGIMISFDDLTEENLKSIDLIAELILRCLPR